MVDTLGMPPRRPFRYTLWKLGIGVMLFVIVAAATHAVLPVDKQLHGGDIGKDLMPSYAAGRLVAEGRGHQLFNAYEVTRIVRQTWADAYPADTVPTLLAPWLNPAFYALPFAPLSRLGYGNAQLVWLTANLLFIGVSCAALMRLLPPAMPWSVKGLVPLLVVCSFPFVQAMCYQQNTFLSLAILSTGTLLAMRSVATGSPRLAFAAGVVVGLLAFKPQLAVVATIAIAVSVGYRAVVGAALSVVTLFAMGEWAIPGSTAAFAFQMPVVVATLLERAGFPWSSHVTLLSFWRLLLQGPTGATSTPVNGVWITSIGVVGLMLCRAAWTVRRHRHDDPAIHRRWLAAAVCATPLVMPYFMGYDLLLLAVAGTLFAVDGLTTSEMSRSDRRTAWLWVAFSLWLLFQPPFAMGWRVNVNVVLLATVTFAMVRRVHTNPSIATLSTRLIHPVILRRAA